MQYFEQASETETTTNNIYCTLTSERTVSTDSGSYTCTLTNDLSKVTKVFRSQDFIIGERFDTFVFKLVFTSAEEDLPLGLVHFEPTGSYTYVIKDTFFDRIIDKGKAIIYPNGEFSTSNKFGNEVTYTEHTNPTTNTIYIQA